MIIEEMESRDITIFLNSKIFKEVENDISETLKTAQDHLDEAESLDDIRKLQGRILAYKEFLSLRTGLQAELIERKEQSGAE